MAYLLDADWAIHALAGHGPAVTTMDRLAPAQIRMSLLTVGEVYERAFESVHPEAHLDAFRRFLRPFRLLGIDEPIVVRFAEVRSLLRRRGELISDFDIMLAATALHHDLTVLTFNIRHLGRVPGLRLFTPPT